MLICLDFDGTYTEDVDYLDTFIHQANRQNRAKMHAKIEYGVLG